MSSEEEDAYKVEDNEDMFQTWNILHIDICRKITPEDFGILTRSNNEIITGKIIFYYLEILRQINKESSPNSVKRNFVTSLLKSLKHEEVKRFLYNYDFLILAKYLLQDSLPYCTTIVVEMIASLCHFEDETPPDYVIEMIEWIGKDKNLVANLVRYLNYFMEEKDADLHLVRNTLDFFHSVALILKINPASVWVKRLQTCNFENYILYLLQNNYQESKVSFSTIALAIFAVLSEVNSSNASEFYSLSLLNDIFNVETVISILCDMQYFDQINDASLPHWKFYENWLTLVDNIREKNLFIFNSNLQYSRKIFGHVRIMLEFFEKALRQVLQGHARRTSTLARLFEHTSVVDKCMRLAEGFKKCDSTLIPILQITCGIEQKFLSIRLLLDLLNDGTETCVWKTEIEKQNEASDTETEISRKTVLHRIADFKTGLDQYLDSAVEKHSNDYYSLYNILHKCIQYEQDLITSQIRSTYLNYLEKRVLHVTRNDEQHPLRQTFNMAKQEIMMNTFFKE